MDLIVCRAKLNKARVSSCNTDYSGSLAVDARVLAALDVIPYEKVLVVNRSNGERFETYVVPAEKGVVELQGGAARLGAVGDVIGFLAFAVLNEEEARNANVPTVVELADDNTVINIEQS